MRKRLTGVMALAMLLVVGLIAPAIASQTTPGGPAVDDDGKIWVCKYVGQPGSEGERLKSGKNPIHVNASTELQGANLEGTDVEVEDLQFGDSWTDGQSRSAIANEDGSCEGTPETVAITPERPSTTPATCDANGTIVLPVTTGVTYRVDGDATVPGTYNVYATLGAEVPANYELPNGGRDQLVGTFTVEAQLDANSDACTPPPPPTNGGNGPPPPVTLTPEPEVLPGLIEEPEEIEEDVTEPILEEVASGPVAEEAEVLGVTATRAVPTRIEAGTGGHLPGSTPTAALALLMLGGLALTGGATASLARRRG